MSSSRAKELEAPFFTVRDANLATARSTVLKANMASLYDALQQTYLFFCANRVREGGLELAQICVARGVDFAAQDRNGQTALFYAAGCGNLEVVRYLATWHRLARYEAVAAQEDESEAHRCP